MKKGQDAKFRMYKAVISYCDNNTEIISSIPALQAAVTSFKNATASIADIAQQKSKVISGFAADKTQLRKTLSLLAASIASSVSAYASATNNNELKNRVDVTVSGLLRLKDGELASACMNLLNLVNENLAALADYNVTQLTVNNFESLIKEYMGSVPLSRNAVSERSARGASLTEKFREADNILKTRMDKIITTLQSTQAEFYQTYKKNRIIVGARTTITQIKGLITDNKTSKPLSGVSITLLQIETSVTTGKDGRYKIKPIAPGNYTIIISKEGFQTITITKLHVKLGQVTTVNVRLMPVA